MARTFQRNNNDVSSLPDTPETMSLKSTSSTSSFPETGILDEFLEFEGTTIFATPPSPTYRYSMSLKSGYLRIWLEDCDSKKQWCTTKLALEDYVDSTNAIPNATASDYVEYFRELLDGARDDMDNIPIMFQRHKGEIFRLEVTVKIQVLKQSRVAKYVIDLEPISLERIDVLESKMRDLQEEVEELRDESEEVIANHSRGLQELKVEFKLQQEDLEKREDEIEELKRQLKELHVAKDGSTTVQMQATTRKGGMGRVGGRSQCADVDPWHVPSDGHYQLPFDHCQRHDPIGERQQSHPVGLLRR